MNDRRGRWASAFGWDRRFNLGMRDCSPGPAARKEAKGPRQPFARRVSSICLTCASAVSTGSTHEPAPLWPPPP